MDKRYVIIILIAILLVLAVGLWFVKGPARPVPAAPETGGSATKGALPANVVVPDGKGQAPADVAAPTTVIPAAPGVDAKYRTFDLVYEHGAVNPSVVSVHVGDTVHISLSAKDGTYDFTQPDLGLNLPFTKISAGGTRVIEFAAPPSAGKYMFYCASCGGPQSGPIGYIYVVPVNH